MVPDYETFMLPILRVLAQMPVSVETAAQRVADALDLTEATRAQRPAWSHEPLVVARTRVAAESLAAAGLIDRSADQLRIAARGRALLDENPSSLSREGLRRYPEFEAYLQAYLARQGA